MNGTDRTRLVLAAAGLSLVACFTSLARGQAPAHPTNPKAGPIVVGTFDSRALAVASARSTAFREYLGELHGHVGKALELARERGDTALVKQLDALGPDMQQRLHEQSFGTAPIDDILARLAPALPAIAQELGVDLIVSRWDLVHVGEKAVFVDVTGRLVTELGADEATRKVIDDLMRQMPVPTSDLDHDH